MHESKRKRLEADGWKFGDAKDFLGLTNSEALFVELKLKLGESLRQRRLEQGLTQVGLAKLLHSSQSRVAKMEAGDPAVSIDLLIRALVSLGASSKDIARTISKAA